MKITGIKIHHVEWERGPYHWRDEIMPAGATGRPALLRILTDEGIEGLSPYTAGARIEAIKYQLVGEDPLNRERIWHKFWRNLRSSKLGLAVGPVDCALWDLLGKVCGEPVYKLLGGMRDRIPAYASTVTLDSLDEYMDLADECLEKGYKAIKLHAWGRLEEDAELCRALRDRVGGDIELMYDASSMFNLFEDAVWFGRRLEEQGYYWYEEPMDHFNMTALSRLVAQLEIPLAVAEGFGMMCAIHGGSIPHLHAACAIYNTKYFERLVPETYYSPPGIRDASTEIDGEGYAGPWDKPGFGIEVDWDWVEKHTVSVEE
jgi:L-alanine-DL-glutamate epimerase-like enolase superfamily enzyme